MAVDPWRLRTPGTRHTYFAWREPSPAPPSLVVQVGRLQRRYRLSSLEDAAEWLRAQGDWVPLGASEEHEEPPVGSLEAWARAQENPVGGWYGLRPGYRGHFATFVSPLLVFLGSAECTRLRGILVIRARGEP